MVKVRLEMSQSITRKAPQFIASCTACLGAFILGTVFVWPAPALPGLVASKDCGELTLDELSWIVSLFCIGGLVSGPIAGYAMNKWGRRGALILMSFPCIGAWVLIAMAENVYTIYAGRTLLGCCVGSFAIFVNVYIAEIAEDEIRGTLGFLYPITTSIGVLFTYITGAFVSWRTLTLINTAFPIVLLLGMYLIPESPIFLLGQGQYKRAGRALQWLRGASSFEDIEDELQKTQSYVESRSSTVSPKMSWRDYFDPSVLKPVGLSLGLLILQNLTGVSVMMANTVQIFKDAGSNVEPNLASIIVGAVMLGSCCIATPCIDRVGRRVLLQVSALGMALSLGVLSGYIYLRNGGSPCLEQLGWVPLASLLVFGIFLNWGFGPVPWLMVGEIIPAHVKGGASAVVASVSWLFSFGMLKTFEGMKDLYGLDGVYLFFASCCFLAMIFTYFCVPETRGKTLSEIEKHFSRSPRMPSEKV